MERRTFLHATTTGALALNSMGVVDERVVRVGIVGVGNRGLNLTRALLDLDNVEVSAIGDINEENLAKAQQLCVKRGREKPEGYSRGPEDFLRLCDRNDLDAVVTATPWQWHTPVMLAALDAGKYGATEVPAAITVDECWALVEKSESTGMPCMMLENACYSRALLAIWNLIRSDLLGKIFHFESGYNHDVRHEKFNDDGTLTWRGEHSVHRNGNLYPTHQLGPIALVMDFNRGNRMETLVSMATNSYGLNNYAVERFGPDNPNVNRTFKNGDVSCTLIKLADGNFITQYHDTQSWRPREDIFRFHGTKGIVAGTQEKIYAIKKHYDGKQTHNWEWHNLRPFVKEFDHPMWKQLGDKASPHGHGGTDWMTMRGFIEAVRHKTQTPLTVYDAASWSVVAPLSEQSIAEGSRTVNFPDFTKGKWKTNLPFELQWKWT
jgi:predicted dehydrogenase